MRDRRGGGAGRLVPHPHAGQAGYVTVELAVGLLSLAVVTAFALGLVGLAVTQIRLADAAHTAARLAARQADVETVRATVRRSLPTADVDFAPHEDQMWVRVTDDVGGSGVLPAITLHAEAVAPLEEPAPGEWP